MLVVWTPCSPGGPSRSSAGLAGSLLEVMLEPGGHILEAACPALRCADDSHLSADLRGRRSLEKPWVKENWICEE